MQVSDVLARVLKQLQVVTKEAENRQGVLAAIDLLNRANEESDWLSVYEDDPLKYKVSHSNLQDTKGFLVRAGSLMRFARRTYWHHLGRIVMPRIMWNADMEMDELHQKLSRSVLSAQGRDSTRKIQRAIAAGEMRKQLPQLVSDLVISLEDYRDSCGKAFTFYDKDYQVRGIFPHCTLPQLASASCQASTFICERIVPSCMSYVHHRLKKLI